MKIEQLLVQHFYNSKEVTLQGMGTFTLSGDFVMPKENEKDAEIPEHAISFQYNGRATEDEALIHFIVQQTRKMKALASADLDSYLALGKQFLNIGKPFIIEGMGVLLKNQQGELEFTKGGSWQTKMEATPAALKEKAGNPEISFASESKSDAGHINKKAILAGTGVLLLGLIAVAAWYFLLRKNNTETETPVAEVKVEPIITDTAKTDTAKTDTTVTMPLKPVVANDGYSFKVVFMVSRDSAASVRRMNDLTRRYHKVIMYKADSVRFKLAEPFKLPLSDTTRIKDSLNSYYYLGKAFIELN
ncbi:MAG: hypothetical protein WBO39_01735 [Ferruginibacter sp.]